MGLQFAELRPTVGLQGLGKGLLGVCGMFGDHENLEKAFVGLGKLQNHCLASHRNNSIPYTRERAREIERDRENLYICMSFHTTVATDSRLSYHKQEQQQKQVTSSS